MLAVITKQITRWHWWTLQCFSFYRMIHHSIKPKYKTSAILLMANTNIKLEGCSLVAPARDRSRHQMRARWLTSLTHCESMPLPSEVIDSFCSVTPLTPYPLWQRLPITAQAAFKDFDNITSPWKYTGFITRHWVTPSRHQIAIRHGRQRVCRLLVILCHFLSNAQNNSLKLPFEV